MIINDILLDDIAHLKCKDRIHLNCKMCGSEYSVKAIYIKSMIRGTIKRQRKFCSTQCANKDMKASYRCKELSCKQCNCLFLPMQPQQLFCSKTCSATYNNTHKTHGTRRSKLECWIENRLTNIYPKLEIHFNRKDAINSELDIYIPSLKLAIELNGIFHYEPIFSTAQLIKCQNNDNRKMQACLEKNIELCIIDTSQQKYFKPDTSQKYLDIINSIINLKIPATGLEPMAT
jgi:hypothetical protein